MYPGAVGGLIIAVPLFFLHAQGIVFLLNINAANRLLCLSTQLLL